MKIVFESYFTEEKNCDIFEIVTKEIEINEILFYKVEKWNEPTSIFCFSKQKHAKKSP
ncbi:MAG: hypothetical protein ACR2M6_03355 [Vampirovibrionia bacterium]